MIPTKRVAKVLGCMLVMGFGAELQAVKFADVWANLSNRLRFLSRARDAMPTGEGFFRNWFDDNVCTPNDRDRAEESFTRRQAKLETKLDSLKGSACNMAAIVSGREQAAKFKKEVHKFFSTTRRTTVIVTDSSNKQHSVSYEKIRTYDSGSDRYVKIESYASDLQLWIPRYDNPRRLFKCKFKGDQEEAFEKSWREYKFLSDSKDLKDDYREKFLKANKEWNNGKITRFLPATYEQRYGTLATAMLMRWISTGEHPGQQVKKLAKVPGRLLSRARGMITRDPSK